jgi:sedoheptulose-bisphosphatase
MRDFLASQFKDAGRDGSAVESEKRAEALLDVIDCIGWGCAQTAVALRTAIVQKVQTTNEFGDDVLTVDLIADRRICDALRGCAHVAAYASEEHPQLTVVRSINLGQDGHSANMFTVTFDPLDGSSVIDTNFSVGSIFAIWSGPTCVGQQVKQIAASVVAVYGPRTTLFVAHKSFGVFEFLLVSDDGKWRLVRSKPFEVQPKALFFSPGNLRAANDVNAYRKFLQNAITEKRTLRYTGGMVPDVTQILVKGSGVFATPTSPNYKVKLRVCFECAPLTHLMVCANGLSVDELGRDYEEKTVEGVDQRSGIVLGSRDAVTSLSKGLGAANTGSSHKPKKAKL